MGKTAVRDDSVPGSACDLGRKHHLKCMTRGEASEVFNIQYSIVEFSADERKRRPRRIFILFIF